MKICIEIVSLKIKMYKNSLDIFNYQPTTKYEFLAIYTKAHFRTSMEVNFQKKTSYKRRSSFSTEEDCFYIASLIFKLALFETKQKYLQSRFGSE